MTRKYEKTGLFSKKIKQYLSQGELDNILLSIKKFEEWINKSSKGNKITYYRGYIMAPHLQKFSPTTDDRRVNSLKNYVHRAYNHNLVTLVQKRHGDLDYEYIAVRI
jgi:hypothetical protein